jgi:hypothetical protein
VIEELMISILREELTTNEEAFIAEKDVMLRKRPACRDVREDVGASMVVFFNKRKPCGAVIVKGRCPR